MRIGKLATIFGLAIEAWMMVFVAIAGLQLLFTSLLG